MIYKLLVAMSLFSPTLKANVFSVHLNCKSEGSEELITTRITAYSLENVWADINVLGEGLRADDVKCRASCSSIDCQTSFDESSHLSFSIDLDAMFTNGVYEGEISGNSIQGKLSCNASMTRNCAGS